MSKERIHTIQSFKKDDSKRNTYQKDNSKSNTFKLDNLKTNTLKKDYSNSNILKRDYSKPSILKRDYSKPSILKKDNSKPSILKKDNSKPSILKKDDSKSTPLKKEYFYATPYKVISNITNEYNTNKRNELNRSVGHRNRNNYNYTTYVVTSQQKPKREVVSIERRTVIKENNITKPSTKIEIKPMQMKPSSTIYQRKEYYSNKGREESVKEREREKEKEKERQIQREKEKEKEKERREKEREREKERREKEREKERIKREKERERERERKEKERERERKEKERQREKEKEKREREKERERKEKERERERERKEKERERERERKEKERQIKLEKERNSVNKKVETTSPNAIYTKKIITEETTVVRENTEGNDDRKYKRYIIKGLNSPNEEMEREKEMEKEKSKYEPKYEPFNKRGNKNIRLLKVAHNEIDNEKLDKNRAKNNLYNSYIRTKRPIDTKIKKYGKAESELIDDLAKIENYNKNTYLKNDLLKIYDSINEEFNTFKKDIFYSNVSIFLFFNLIYVFNNIFNIIYIFVIIIFISFYFIIKI